jgi:hypothetical protein
MKKIVLSGLIFLLIHPAYCSPESDFISLTSKTFTQPPMNFIKRLFTPKDKRSLTEIVGVLEANPDYKGWYETLPVLIPYAGAPLKITFANGDDSLFMSEAEVVLKRFLQLTETDRLANSKWVERYYQVCLKELKFAPLAIHSAKDVWNFAIPQNIFIERNGNGKYYVSISYTCDWDKTNGLQLVFREGKKLTRVSGHDGQYEDWN